MGEYLVIGYEENNSKEISNNTLQLLRECILYHSERFDIPEFVIHTDELCLAMEHLINHKIIYPFFEHEENGKWIDVLFFLTGALNRAISAEDKRIMCYWE